MNRTANHRPPVQGGIGLQLSGTSREIDWDVYHYSGPYTGPNATLHAELSGTLRQLPSDPETLLFGLDLSQARVVLLQAHETMHMTGFGAARVFGGATVRLEAAYFIARPYLRSPKDLVAESIATLTPEQFIRIASDLENAGRTEVLLDDLFPSLDSAEWRVGVDYFFRGFFPLLQINQTVILDSAPRLLIADPDTRCPGFCARASGENV